MNWTNKDNEFWPALLEGLHEYDRPVAKEVLLRVANPIDTGVPTKYIMPITRGILETYVPSLDIAGFATSIVEYVIANFDKIDVGNRLGADHEAQSMTDMVKAYLAEVDYSKY